MSFKTLLICLVAGCLLGTCLTLAYGQDVAPENVPQDTRLSLWDLLKQGGWAMIPLTLCSFLMIAFAVINFRQVSRKRFMPPDTVAAMDQQAQARDLQGLWQTAQRGDSAFARAMTAGLRHYSPDRPEDSKVKMENAIGEVISREESQVSFWINFCSLIAAVSPMIGLLGTVSGMIGAFQKIGQGGMGKPEMLAGNIGEALITTATGLVIAIPAMFFYFLFKNMLNRILVQAEEVFSRLLDHITGTGGDLFASAPVAAPVEEPLPEEPA
jgi:biopolymer transport protein ExbB